MGTLIQCCNEALTQIAAGRIVTLTEGTLEALYASQSAPLVLDEIPHWAPWQFLQRRVALAQIANDRPAEWLYAYACPSDVARALAIREVEDAATCLPVNGPGTFPRQDATPIPFALESAVIYCNVANATLSYISAVVDAGDLPPLLRLAFVLELAARICLPIKKDTKLAQWARQEATVAKLAAIADEENKAPHRSVEYVSEAEWARAGWVQ